MKKLNCLLALVCAMLMCTTFMLGCGGGGGGGGSNPVGPSSPAEPSNPSNPTVPSTWLQTSETGVYLQPYAATLQGIQEITSDPSGNLYACIGGSVHKVSGGSFQKLADGDSIQSIAYYNGSLVFSESTNGLVKAVTSAGAVSTLLSGLSFPRSLDNDSAGNLIINNWGANTTIVLSQGGAQATWDNKVSSGFGVNALSFDVLSDTLYFLDNQGDGNSAVSRVSAANKLTGAKVELFRFNEDLTGTLLKNVSGSVPVSSVQAFSTSIVPFSGGYLVGCESGGLALIKNGQCKSFALSSGHKTYVTRDPSGNIYVSEYSSGKIYKVVTQ